MVEHATWYVLPSQCVITLPYFLHAFNSCGQVPILLKHPLTSSNCVAARPLLLTLHSTDSLYSPLYPIT
jgi:hypothetical protein